MFSALTGSQPLSNKLMSFVVCFLYLMQKNKFDLWADIGEDLISLYMTSSHCVQL